MSEKLSFLESLALKLSGIPGLGFLDQYLTRIRSAHSSVRQKVAGYQAYASAATGAAQDIKEELQRERREKKPADDEEHEG